MIQAPVTAPETTDQWAALSARPWNEWSHDDKRLFIAYVDEQKTGGGKGSVTKACDRFGVKQVTLGYWRKTLAKQADGNSVTNPKAGAAGSNGHANVPNGNSHPDAADAAPAADPIEAEDAPTAEADAAVPTPAEIVEESSARIRTEIEAVMHRADQLAMALEKKGHPLASSLGYAVLGVRELLRHLKDEGEELPPDDGRTTAMVAEEIMAILRKAEARYAAEEQTAREELTVERATVPVAIEEPEDTPLAEAEAPVAAPEEAAAMPVVHEPAEEPIAEPAPETETPAAPAPVIAESTAKEPSPAAKPIEPVPVAPPVAELPEEKPRVAFEHIEKKYRTREEAFIASANLLLFAGATTYKQALEVAIKHCLRQTRLPLGDIEAALSVYDPSEHGSMAEFVREGRWKSLPAPRADFPGQQESAPALTPHRKHFLLGKKFHRDAFALAQEIHRRECPPDVGYDEMKTTAYNAFRSLAFVYEEHLGNFWAWAEPFVEQALLARIGKAETPKLPTQHDVGDGEEPIQLTAGEKSIRGTLKKIKNYTITVQEASRHERLIAWVNERAEGGRASTFHEAAEPILHAYKDAIERLADEVQEKTGGRFPLWQITDSLADTVARSIRYFDPAVSDDLGSWVDAWLGKTIATKFLA